MSDETIRCNNQTAKKLSFGELVKERTIEIPIIQRDYAQGRKDKVEIRNNFLNSLFNALTKDIDLELDFIYGSVNGNSLQPLDGQQRLTTLFLLHWYIANKEGEINLAKDTLQKFTYETRISSREFCRELVNKGIDFKNLLIADIDENKKTKNNEVSKTIIDSTWFFLSWEKDPTIKAMLIMLNAIHEKFKNENELWGKLNKISFQYIELSNFGLSDDLYIKMNARGKSLTEFENFKAKFEQYITEYKWEEKIPTVNTFSHKIDTVWTDLFWKHKGKDNVVDNKFMNFIAGIAINNYALIGDETKVQELSSTPNNVRIMDFPDKSFFDNLIKSIDLYACNEKCFDELLFGQIAFWDYFSDKSSLFIEFIRDSGPTYKQRVLFYAQTLFLIDSKEKNGFFLDWMRFIRNIVENTTIDSPATFVSAVKSINLLKEFKNNILVDLKEGKCDKIPFFGTQIIEEKIKATLILNENNLDWRQHIINAENHLMFKGQIIFLFNDKENSDLTVFNRWHAKATEIFEENELGGKYKNNSLLIRVLVSQFDKWELFWELNYDSTKDNWKKILRNAKLIPYLQRILDIDLFEEIVELLQIDSKFDDIQKIVHEDLFKSELLNGIIKECYLRWENEIYILYPYNARADWKKYVVGSNRNKLLSDAINEGIISMCYNQQLKVNEKLIPYFWGRDIHFVYKELEYIWKYSNEMFQILNSEIIKVKSKVQIEFKDMFQLK